MPLFEDTDWRAYYILTAWPLIHRHNTIAIDGFIRPLSGPLIIQFASSLAIKVKS